MMRDQASKATHAPPRAILVPRILFLAAFLFLSPLAVLAYLPPPVPHKVLDGDGDDEYGSPVGQIPGLSVPPGGDPAADPGSRCPRVSTTPPSDPVSTPQEPHQRLDGRFIRPLCSWLVRIRMLTGVR